MEITLVIGLWPYMLIFVPRRQRTNNVLVSYCLGTQGKEKPHPRGHISDEVFFCEVSQHLEMVCLNECDLLNWV